ncbi:MAG: MFS transporter [Clostridia bacterium]|nr:MFS transporter [Clostridia bacterium]
MSADTPRPRPRRGPERDPDFLRLWVGQSVSELGSAVTGLAFPFVAIALGAGAAEMGYLRALQMAPFLLLALFAGVWVDRVRKRPLLIAADVVRFLLLAAVPAGWALGLLAMGHLYVIALAAGVATVVFDVAYQSYLPSLVARAELVAANARLEVTRSLAGLVGPSLGGFLVARLGAALALGADALSYAVSFLSLAAIRRAEPQPERAAGEGSVLREIGEGLRTVTGNPVLRAIAGCTATSNFFASGIDALYVLYATSTLGLGPEAVGAVQSAFAVGAVAGAFASGPASRRFGLGRTIAGSALLIGIGALALPLAGGPTWTVLAVLALGNAMTGFAIPVYNVNQVSLRQAITPDRLLGRMTASMRFIVWGTMPLGALAGGFLGTALGLRPAVAVLAFGVLLAFVWVRFSPVWTLSGEPQVSEAA